MADKSIRVWARRGLASGVCIAMLAVSLPGRAFVHIVRSGETIAGIAERMYGRVQLERVIVAANGLHGRDRSATVPGMRLELPAVGYHRVLPGDRWQSLALQHLGDEARADVLAEVNDSHSWLVPDVGREVVVPYSLRFVASHGDTTQTVAYRFLGRRKRAWMVASYNRLKRARLRQGEVILVPLTELELTEQGRQAARNAGALLRAEAGGAARAVQQRAQKEIPALARDVRRGRYIEAIVRGAALGAGRGVGGLSEAQRAEVARQLTEAYVALGATGLATRSCANWLKNAPSTVLSRIEHSPKILAVCGLPAAESERK